MIAIELVEVSTDTWNLPGPQLNCVDRTSDEELDVDYNPAGSNDLIASAVSQSAVSQSVRPPSSTVFLSGRLGRNRRIAEI